MPAAGSKPLPIDVVIFGGGVTGLWTLDAVSRTGRTALLLEAGALGSGQTVASQGIIHGGLKYTLGGMLTRSATAIRDLPDRWRRCLAGEATPDLRDTRRRAEFCYLWQTESLRSKFGMVGARAGLRVAPTPLDVHERPELLRDVRGVVARLDEQVIEPETMLTALSAPWRDRILRIDIRSGLELVTGDPGTIRLIRLLDPDTGDPLDIAPDAVVFAAGAGNDRLLLEADLQSVAMQRRPLHMVVARGRSLPPFCGHCVDGMRTRATITGLREPNEFTVWQIGGHLSETGVERSRSAQIAHTRAELCSILPGFDPSGVAWTTYRVDRAEPRCAGGRRPNDAFVRRIGNCLITWPVKLVLAPVVADRILAKLAAPRGSRAPDAAILKAWPRPHVAVPPWETAPSSGKTGSPEEAVTWIDDASVERISS